MPNEYSMEVMQMLEELMAGTATISLISSSFSSLVSLAVYIFTALALYNIASRRGIAHPWLAWIPFTQFWTLAAISDHYQLKAKQRAKNKRMAMLIITIILFILAVALGVLAVVMIVAMAGSGMEFESMEAMGPMIGILLGVIAVSLLVVGLSIALAVLQYMALYDVYRSCDPGNAVVFLVLSLFFNIAQPILLMLAQNKDYGMPRPAAPVQFWQPTEEENTQQL